jgi:hypothetical protein
VCRNQQVSRGVLLGYAVDGRVAERWVARLVEQGIDANSIWGLAQHLGRKQAFECIESKRLVGEFCWVTRLMAE